MDDGFGLPDALDQAPLTAIVRGFLAGNCSLEQAAEKFFVLEKQIGVYVWKEILGDAALDGIVRVPKEQGITRTLRKILGTTATFENLEDYYRYSTLEEQNRHDQLIDTFLDQTHMLLRGIDFTDEHFLILRDGSIHSWTQRDWGGVLACWANDRKWGLHCNKNGDMPSWDYVVFAFGPGDLYLDGYERWAEAVFRIIDRKTRLFLDESFIYSRV